MKESTSSTDPNKRNGPPRGMRSSNDNGSSSLNISDSNRVETYLSVPVTDRTIRFVSRLSFVNKIPVMEVLRTLVEEGVEQGNGTNGRNGRNGKNGRNGHSSDKIETYLSVRIPDETAKSLNQLADEREAPVMEVLRELVAEEAEEKISTLQRK